MPNFQQHAVLDVAGNVRAYLKLEVGIVRGEVPAPAEAVGRTPDLLHQQLAAKNQEISRLRARFAAGEVDATTGGIPPDHFIWIFGVARTGSSWLGAMMGDLDDHATWYEPYVGDVFGYAYYMRAGEQQRGREDYILGDPYKGSWTRSLRRFVLEGAYARFPELGENGYLVIKEPNGSVGAPLLVEALPESRLILLVRDPRDVVASLLAAQKEGSWGAGEDPLADTDPDEFVKQRARMYDASFGKAWEAYEAHEGRKVATRYEDLRYDTTSELRRIYSSLGIPIGGEQLRRVVEKHAWENIPDRQKGPDKPRRKATPGGWQDDLTPQQARMVEEITTPILNEFYPGWERAAPSD
jgi:Sulfotransferase family